eukprot:PRCOL_00002816-RA
MITLANPFLSSEQLLRQVLRQSGVLVAVRVLAGESVNHVAQSLVRYIKKRWKVGLAAAVVSGTYFAYRLKQHWRFSFRRWMHNRHWAKQLLKQQQRAKQYRDWLAAELAIEDTKDHAPEGFPPLPPAETGLYDDELVQRTLEELRARRERGNPREMMFALRADLMRNLGGICNPRLHDSVVVTPRLVTEYLDEVELHLRYITRCKDRSLKIAERLAFMVETRHAHGRSALLLTGGGTMAIFHVGVVQALVKHRLLPRIIAGASGGAMVAATVCTCTQEDLLSDDFLLNQTKAIFGEDGRRFMPFDEVSLRNIVTKGAMHGAEQLKTELRRILGDFTFQEAHDKSGRILNIVVVPMRKQKHDPPRLLNYLSAPNVVIWSAVAASCAFPGLLPAQELLAKDHRGKFVPWHNSHAYECGSDDGSSNGKSPGSHDSLNTLSGSLPGMRHRRHSLGSLPSMLGGGGSFGEGSADSRKKHNPRQFRDGSLERDLPMQELSEMLNVNFFIVSQTNPHVVHYLRYKKWCWRNARWLYNLSHFVEAELKLVARTLLELEVVNDRVWLPLLAQPWEGDINIVLPASARQVMRAQSNVSLAEYHQYVRQGQREAWSSLAAIRTTCAVELALDEAVNELKLERARALRKRRQERALVVQHRNLASTAQHAPDTATLDNGDWESPTPSRQHSVDMPNSPMYRGRIPSWNCVRDAVLVKRSLLKAGSDSSLSDRESDIATAGQLDPASVPARTSLPVAMSVDPYTPTTKPTMPTEAAVVSPSSQTPIALPRDDEGSAMAVVSSWSRQYSGVGDDRSTCLSWHAGGADDIVKHDSLVLELAAEDPGALEETPVDGRTSHSMTPAHLSSEVLLKSPAALTRTSSLSTNGFQGLAHGNGGAAQSDLLPGALSTTAHLSPAA